MKLFPALVIAAAVLAIGSTSFAKDCPPRPAKLSIPDGGTATEDAMKATQAKLPAYAQAMSAYMRCLADEIKSGKDEYDSVSANWKAQSDKFRSTPAKAP
jgi:hypothetical protein